MTICKPCGEPKMEFTQLKKDIAMAQSKYVLAPVPLEMVFACGIIESYGNRFFEGTESQYHENLAVALRWSKMSKLAFLSLVKVNGGDAAGRMAKFRYEPSWNSMVHSQISKHGNVEEWRTRLHLSIGYFQKGMVFHLSAKKLQDWDSSYEKFKRDPIEQVRVCANDLHILMQGAHGDMRLAFTRYNGGPTRSQVSNYGDRAYDLYKSFASNSPFKR